MEQLMTDEKLFEMFYEQDMKLLKIGIRMDEIEHSGLEKDEMNDAISDYCDALIDIGKLGKELADRRLVWRYLAWKEDKNAQVSD